MLSVCHLFFVVPQFAQGTAGVAFYVAFRCQAGILLQQHHIVIRYRIFQNGDIARR